MIVLATDHWSCLEYGIEESSGRGQAVQDFEVSAAGVGEGERQYRRSLPCPRNQPAMIKRKAEKLIDTQCRRWTVALRKRRFKSWRTRLFKGWSQHQTAAMIPWGDWSERLVSVMNQFSFFADTRLPFIGPSTRCN